MAKKLLCATDGSHPSEKAVLVAIDLAKSLGAALAFLTVETVSPERAAKTYFWDSKLLEAGDALVHRELGSARKAAESAGLVNVRCVTTCGRDIAQAIVAYADSEGYDHIVVGSAGRKGINKLMLGSVAQAVTAQAHCPVTVAR